MVKATTRIHILNLLRQKGSMTIEKIKAELDIPLPAVKEGVQTLEEQNDIICRDSLYDLCDF